MRRASTRKGGTMEDFVLDLKIFSKRAREKMNEGAFTNAADVDLRRLIYVLNQALATELASVLRYKRHFTFADLWNAKVEASEFLALAGAEQEHADIIVDRIQQLGGDPKFVMNKLIKRFDSILDESISVGKMIGENLEAERITIVTYGEIISWVGDRDPTTRGMLEDILAAKEVHAQDLLVMLGGNFWFDSFEIVPSPCLYSHGTKFGLPALHNLSVATRPTGESIDEVVQ
jgi:bacterioferritin